MHFSCVINATSVNCVKLKKLFEKISIKEVCVCGMWNMLAPQIERWASIRSFCWPIQIYFNMGVV